MKSHHDHRRGAELAGCADRHVVEHASVHEHLTAPAHGRQQSRHGDRGSEGHVQRAAVDHDGGTRPQVGRDGGEAARQVLDQRVLAESAVDGIRQGAGVEKTQARGQRHPRDRAPAEGESCLFDRRLGNVGGIGGGHERAGARARDDIGTDAAGSQLLQDSHVRGAIGPAAAEGEPQRAAVSACHPVVSPPARSAPALPSVRARGPLGVRRRRRFVAHARGVDRPSVASSTRWGYERDSGSRSNDAPGCRVEGER